MATSTSTSKPPYLNPNPLQYPKKIQKLQYFRRYSDRISNRIRSDRLRLPSLGKRSELGGWLVVEGWIKPSLFDGIPHGDMLDGTHVQLKSVMLQKYVSAENGGGMNVTVGKDIPSSWETFRVIAVRESSRLCASLKEKVPVRRLIVYQVLSPSESNCNFCEAKWTDQMRALDMIRRDPKLAGLSLIQAPLVDVEIRVSLLSSSLRIRFGDEASILLSAPMSTTRLDSLIIPKMLLSSSS